RHAYLLDWEKTRAYAPTPSSNGIHIVQSGPGHPGGVAEPEYEAFRRRLAHELQELTDPASGQPVVSRVWTRDEVFEGPHKSLAPDLTLDLRDGGLVSILASDVPFMARSATAGTHRRHGILMARGPGLKHGLRLGGLSILDVAPLLLHSLGLEIPADMEGTLPSAAFEPAWLGSRPVPAAAPRPVAQVQTAADDAFFTNDAQLT